MGKISYKCLRVFIAFWRSYILMGYVRKWSSSVWGCTLSISSCWSLPSTRYIRGWLKVNSERGENVGWWLFETSLSARFEVWITSRSRFNVWNGSSPKVRKYFKLLLHPILQIRTRDLMYKLCAESELLSNHGSLKDAKFLNSLGMRTSSRR